MKHLILVIFITFLGFQLFGQTISISTHHVKPGSTLQLSFNAPSSYPENAWIGIVPLNIEHGSEAVNDKHDLTYQYLKKRTSGSLSFKVDASMSDMNLVTSVHEEAYSNLKLLDKDVDFNQM